MMTLKVLKIKSTAELNKIKKMNKVKLYKDVSEEEEQQFYDST